MKQLYRFCFVRKDLCPARLKKEVVRLPYHEYNIIPSLGQCDKETCKHTLSNLEWLYYMNMRVDLVHLCGYKGHVEHTCIQNRGGIDLCMAHLGTYGLQGEQNEALKSASTWAYLFAR